MKKKPDRNQAAKERARKKYAPKKCNWPQCENKSMTTVSLPVHIIGEDGNVKPTGNEEQGVSLGVPFCDEHVWYAMNGFAGLIDRGSEMKPEDIELHVPAEQIHLTKTVISQMIMNEELQKMLSEHEKNKQELAKARKEAERQETKENG